MVGAMMVRNPRKSTCWINKIPGFNGADVAPKKYVQNVNL